PADPANVSELPDDPRYPGQQRDYFEFDKRLQQLAGKPMTVRVRRSGGEQNIRVPAAFRRTLGLRMHMGWVAAVRPSSPADKAGLQYPGQIVAGKHVGGDWIDAIEVPEPNGRVTRWTWVHDDNEIIPL